MGQKFKDTFNTKWRLLDNFSTDNVLRQSKHFTGLLFIVLHLYQLRVTDYFEPCSSSIHVSLTFSDNLYLSIYFKRPEFSGSSLQSPQKCFQSYLLLISNFLLSNYHLHVLCSFREAGPFTSPISEFCPINYHKKFYLLFLVSSESTNMKCLLCARNHGGAFT